MKSNSLILIQKIMKLKNTSFHHILIPLTLISCEGYYQDDINFSNEEALEIVSGTLKFKDVNAYDNYMASPEAVSIPQFESLDKTLKGSAPIKGGNLRLNENASIFIEELADTPLLEILDQDGTFIIGDHLIYLDFNTAIAAVTTFPELRENILKGDYSNENIKLFSFDDDVIQLIEEDSPSTIDKSLVNARLASTYNPYAATYSSGCDKTKCAYNGSVPGISNSGSNFEYRIESKHVYQKVAVYFRLFTEIKHMRRPQNSILTYNAENTTMYIWYDYRYLSKKNGSSEKFQNSSTNTFDDKLKPTYYESSRGLEKYTLKSQIYTVPGGNHGYDPLGSFWQFNLAQIKDGY